MAASLQVCRSFHLKTRFTRSWFRDEDCASFTFNLFDCRWNIWVWICCLFFLITRFSLWFAISCFYRRHGRAGISFWRILIKWNFHSVDLGNLRCGRIARFHENPCIVMSFLRLVLLNLWDTVMHPRNKGELISFVSAGCLCMDISRKDVFIDTELWRIIWLSWWRWYRHFVCNKGWNRT